MDYYSQGRTQIPASQVNQHYISFSQNNPTSYSMNMNAYGGQMQSPPAPQSAYQQAQHFSAGPTNSNVDYSSNHAQSISSHSQINSARTRSVRSGVIGTGDAGHQSITTHRIQVPAQKSQEFPVRIVVDHKHVGAIIGNKGTHIKEITTETRARIIVDIHKIVKDSHGNAEKIITIVGPLENSGKAVVRIMEIVQRELERDETRDPPTEVELKIRAHNQLVGRLIGRQGSTIKKIMQDTGTTIYVSNSNEAQPRLADSALNNILPNFPEVLVQLERTITVKGPNIEHVAAAEQRISAKLRQSFEMDLQNRLQMAAAHSVGGIPFIPPVNDQWNPCLSRMLPTGSNQQPKTIKLFVPNNMVGAIIGTKGMNIRNIIRNSGAMIKIDGGENRRERVEDENRAEAGPSASEFVLPPLQNETEENNGHPADGQPSNSTDQKTERDNFFGKQDENKLQDDERLVTITGNDMQQFRAQYLIYQRISEQQGCYLDEVKLRTEVIVPSRLVGRIIGKGGQNVRELQRITGASVKIPEDEPKVETIDETSKDSSLVEGTIVRINANIQGSSSVQMRIGQLINEFARSSLNDRRKEENHVSDGVPQQATNKPPSPSSTAE